MSDLWYPCEQPERPPDAFIVWHYDDCRACALASMAVEARHPEDPHAQWLRRRIGDVEFA